jgi:hypothetical protein
MNFFRTKTINIDKPNVNFKNINLTIDDTLVVKILVNIVDYLLTNCRSCSDFGSEKHRELLRNILLETHDEIYSYRELHKKIATQYVQQARDDFYKTIEHSAVYTLIEKLVSYRQQLNYEKNHKE